MAWKVVDIADKGAREEIERLLNQGYQPQDQYRTLSARVGNEYHEYVIFRLPPPVASGEASGSSDGRSLSPSIGN